MMHHHKYFHMFDLTENSTDDDVSPFQDDSIIIIIIMTVLGSTRDNPQRHSFIHSLGGWLDPLKLDTFRCPFSISASFCIVSCQ